MDRILDLDTRDYASALRAIGQQVADFLPLYLEIEVKNGQFEVRGRGLAERSPGKYNSVESFLYKVWNMLIRHDPGADIVEWQLGSVPFARTYTREDIRRWNDNGSTRRKSVTELPDIYSLGERLRIVGRLIDAKQSDLINVSKGLNRVTFRYRDANGQIHSEEYSASDLYRIQQEHFTNRKTANSLDSTFSRGPKKTIAA